MPDIAREGKLLPALLTGSPHDPDNIIVMLVLLFALPAVIRNMIPGRIVKDRLPAVPAGLLQQLWRLLYLNDAHGFLMKQFLKPVKHNIPPGKIIFNYTNINY